MQNLSGYIIFASHQPENILTLDADKRHLPYIQLINSFQSHNISLLPAKYGQARASRFEIHLNVQPAVTNQFSYALIHEPSSILPNNFNRNTLSRYRHIFTWSKELHSQMPDKSTLLAIPHHLSPSLSIGFNERKSFAALIASNKSLRKLDLSVDLYLERLRTIRWYERFQPSFFSLYGSNWSKSPKLPTRIGSLVHKIEDKFPPLFNWFPSWRGTIHDKARILQNSLFNFAYENTIADGYITEKLFDSFVNGCVPIYLGAPNILDYVPSNCFIDRRNFSSNENLFDHLKSIDSKQYDAYQRNINSFLLSTTSSPFSINTFIQAILHQVERDLASK